MEAPKRWGNPEGDPEILDPTPIEMPLGSIRPTPLQDLIANMVRTAISQEKGDEFETMDEANDFEEEDPDVLDVSPYTLQDIESEEISSAEIEEPEPEPDQPTGDPPDPNAVEQDKP